MFAIETVLEFAAEMAKRRGESFVVEMSGKTSLARVEAFEARLGSRLPEALRTLLTVRGSLALDAPPVDSPDAGRIRGAKAFYTCDLVAMETYFDRFSETPLGLYEGLNFTDRYLIVGGTLGTTLYYIPRERPPGATNSPVYCAAEEDVDADEETDFVAPSIEHWLISAIESTALRGSVDPYAHPRHAYRDGCEERWQSLGWLG